MTADRRRDKACIILLFLLLQSSKSMIFKFCKRLKFLNFTNFSLGYIEEKGCNIWHVLAIVIKYHAIIVKT